MENFYTEDIYVGYRYFETFAKDKVKYPFGFGLSYTKFQTEILGISVQGMAVTAVAKVTNVGGVSGRETVQLYLEAPQGKLGKPLRQLTAFAKTEELKPGETEELLLKTELTEYASYDDSGVTADCIRSVMSDTFPACTMMQDKRQLPAVTSSLPVRITGNEHRSPPKQSQKYQL